VLKQNKIVWKERVLEKTTKGTEYLSKPNPCAHYGGIPMVKCTTSLSSVTYAGIDYHKKFSVIALGDKNGKVITSERLPNDCQLIKQFFDQYPNITCAVESCRGYEWFVDYLKGLGLTVHLANPYQTKQIAQSRCKTDKVDSRILMELLAIGFLPTCYQPTPEERALREKLRWRAHLVRYASRMKIRIYSLLDKENLGLAATNLFAVDGRKFLKQVQLSPIRQALLEEHLTMLEYFEELVAKEDAWVKKTALANQQACLLTTIPGIGYLSALIIVAELGDISRFKRAAQVASYVGLVPSIYSSGNVRKTGAITKQGSTLLRWILIQCAWQAVRYSYTFRCHFATVSRRCGRNAGAVSVARKLIQIAYRVLRDQKPFASELVGKQAA
jgi:transposase